MDKNDSSDIINKKGLDAIPPKNNTDNDGPQVLNESFGTKVAADGSKDLKTDDDK